MNLASLVARVAVGPGGRIGAARVETRAEPPVVRPAAATPRAAARMRRAGALAAPTVRRR